MTLIIIKFLHANYHYYFIFKTMETQLYITYQCLDICLVRWENSQTTCCLTDLTMTTSPGKTKAVNARG